MKIARMDGKGRIQIPAEVRKRMRLRQKEVFAIDSHGGIIYLKKPSKAEVSSDPMLRDILERPLHSKIKITSQLLEKLEEEAWTP